MPSPPQSAPPLAQDACMQYLTNDIVWDLQLALSCPAREIGSAAFPLTIATFIKIRNRYMAVTGSSQHDWERGWMVR